MQSEPRVTVDIAVSGRFTTRTFWIVPELLNAYHEFTVDDCAIRVELPNIDDVQNVDHYRTRAYQRQGEGSVQIKNLDIIVFTDKKALIPERSLNMRFNDWYLFPEKQQSHYRQIVSQHYDVIAKAFTRWSRVVRWKSGITVNGPEITQDLRVRAPILIDASTRKRFASADISRFVESDRALTMENWQAVQEGLNSGDLPPVYYELLSDAIKHSNANDVQRCIIDLAIACETYLRDRVMSKTPSDFPPAIRKYIDGAPIAQVINNFYDDVFSKEERAKHPKHMKKKLQKLFNARNDAMHRGETEITVRQCFEHIGTAYALIPSNYNSHSEGSDETS